MRGTRDERIYTFGPYQLDIRSGELRRNNERIPLRPKVFELLFLLVENAGRLMPKRELLDKLWGDVHVEHGSLTRAIAYLRSALNDSAQTPAYVQTVARRGYRFVAVVQKTESPTLSAFYLLVRSDRHGLLEGDNVLGRADDCNVVLKLASISRRHAVITIHGSAATLRDLHSKNGTFLNGRRIEEPGDLEEGDELRLGSVSMMFTSASGDQTTVTDVRIPVGSARRV